MKHIGLIVNKSIDLDGLAERLSDSAWTVLRPRDDELQVLDEQRGYYVAFTELDREEAAEEYAELEDNPLPPAQARYYLVRYKDQAMLRTVLSVLASAPEVWIDLEDGGIVSGSGLIRSASGLAVSNDGSYWHWEGEVFGPNATGWDRYCARVGCIWRCDGV